jgi:hypothetical protein
VGAGEISEELRCPICGRGRVRDLRHDEGGTGEPLHQASDSREVQLFTCGHEVTGSSLDSADAEDLEVERRTSGETVDPPPS